MSNTRVFQNIIETYEAARPGYPDRLFSDIVSHAKLPRNARILEIGSGPGQATDFFVKRGDTVTGLELSEPQVLFLRQKYAGYPNFSAVCSSFEDFPAEEERYDLIFSATAFHWIAPEAGYPKAYALLKKGGTIAVFWHLESLIEPQTEPLVEIRDICRRHAPQLDDFISAAAGEELHALRIGQVQAGGCFPPPATFRYLWEETYSTERYLKLLQSYSDFHEITETQQTAILTEIQAYIDNMGGKITLPLEVRMYLSRK